jgi:hypothetical protein
MTQLLRGAGLVAVLGLFATPLAAQVPGLAVHAPGVPAGVVLAGHVSFPNDAAGGGRVYGASGAVGTGVFGGTAIVALSDPDDDADGTLSVGANLGVRILGGPLVPVSASFLAGIGYAKPESGLLPDDDVSLLHVPVAVSVALALPSPAFSVRPWVAPRLDVLRVSPDGGESETLTDFGVSAGIEVNTISGFGVHAAYDWIAREGDKPAIFDVGIHYAFRVPGL